MMRLLHHVNKRARDGNSKPRLSFTLIELLVVMGIIAVLGVLSMAGYRGIARDARLASGKNAVMAVLDNARGLAMKNNRPTMVVFIPRPIGPKEWRVNAIIAEWTGTVLFLPVNTTPGCVNGAGGSLRVFDRFVPVNGVTPRELPRGISVAGPNYIDVPPPPLVPDTQWFVPSGFVNPNEAPGHIIAVMYGPDGATLTSNPATATAANNFRFVDLDNDGVQDRIFGSTCTADYFIQLDKNDEPCVEMAPFIAVFDQEEARQVQGDDDWNVQLTRDTELSSFINANADRIHFNRYSGVAMK